MRYKNFKAKIEQSGKQRKKENKKQNKNKHKKQKARVTK